MKKLSVERKMPPARDHKRGRNWEGESGIVPSGKGGGEDYGTFILGEQRGSIWEKKGSEKEGGKLTREKKKGRRKRERS